MRPCVGWQRPSARRRRGSKRTSIANSSPGSPHAFAHRAISELDPRTGFAVSARGKSLPVTGKEVFHETTIARCKRQAGQLFEWRPPESRVLEANRITLDFGRNEFNNED